jgi:hypothetical protein
MNYPSSKRTAAHCCIVRHRCGIMKTAFSCFLLVTVAAAEIQSRQHHATAAPKIHPCGQRGRLAHSADLHQEQGWPVHRSSHPKTQGGWTLSRHHHLSRCAGWPGDGTIGGLVAGRSWWSGLGAIPPGRLRCRGRRLPRWEYESHVFAVIGWNDHLHRRRVGGNRLTLRRCRTSIRTA